MLPCATSQTFMDPTKSNHLSQALSGCNSMGVGTTSESQMNVHLFTLPQDKHIFAPFMAKQ